MRNLFVIMTLIVSTNVFSARDHHDEPHLPLELTFKESQKLLRTHWVKFGAGVMKANSPETQMAIDGGEKFSLWLKKINEGRSADEQLRLTNSSNRGSGIPINSPSKYGPKTIKERLNKILAEIPEEMKKVVYGTDTIGDELPVSKEDFIKHGRLVSFLYQSAVRWSTSIEPWLDWYTRNNRRDVRGYFHLKAMADLDEKLDRFEQLPQTEKETLAKHMNGLCRNNDISPKTCSSDFAAAERNGNLKKLKNKYWPGAVATWDSFFKISKPRTDVTWTASAPNVMKAPFIDPKNDKIANWLKDNIEDEFKTSTWNFEMDFVDSGNGTAYLEFKPNVTPHVTRGNIIVMDANSPIEEYDVKWTIRHEYGHILRIPDCYVEFYDEKEEVAVNYQLDVKDLMCSRAGDFNQRIYDELKRNYFKN